jgi:hypothetical protein
VANVESFFDSNNIDYRHSRNAYLNLTMSSSFAYNMQAPNITGAHVFQMGIPGENVTGMLWQYLL